jgi:hypothetical protein
MKSGVVSLTRKDGKTELENESSKHFICSAELNPQNPHFKKKSIPRSQCPVATLPIEQTEYL